MCSQVPHSGVRQRHALAVYVYELPTWMNLVRRWHPAGPTGSIWVLDLGMLNLWRATRAASDLCPAAASPQRRHGAAVAFSHTQIPKNIAGV